MTTTTNLAMTHLEQNQNSPEVTVNEALDRLDDAVAGRLVHEMASDADYTLSTTGEPPEWMHAIIRITDSPTTLTAARNIIVPTNTKLYLFENETAETLTLKTASGSGIAVPANYKALLYCDGTNVVLVSWLTDNSGNLVARGAGTMLGVLESTDSNPVQWRLKSGSSNRRFVALDASDNVLGQVAFPASNELEFGGASFPAWVKMYSGRTVFTHDVIVNAGDLTDTASARLHVKDTTTTAPHGLIETSAAASTTVGPVLSIKRNANGSSATTHAAGEIRFDALSTTGAERALARITAIPSDMLNASEDATLRIRTIVGGTDGNRVWLGSGLWMNGATGGDPGASNINASVYEADGTAGVSVGPYTTITSITVKGGLVTDLQGS